MGLSSEVDSYLIHLTTLILLREVLPHGNALFFSMFQHFQRFPLYPGTQHLRRQNLQVTFLYSAIFLRGRTIHGIPSPQTRAD